MIREIVTATLAGLTGITETPENITQLRNMNSHTVLVNEGDTVSMIVYPGPPSDELEQAYWEYADPDGSTEAYAGLAEKIAKAVATSTGTQIPIKRACEITNADRANNLIVLGRMNNNQVAFDLYVMRRIAADDWFPGPEGYVVRTCTEPWGNGRNVIMLGGSDIEGVKSAVKHFLELPEFNEQSASLSIPRQWKIHFKGMENIDKFAETIMPHYQSVYFDRSYYHGMSHHPVRAAAGYFITGRSEYAEAFRKMMDRAMPADWSKVKIDRRPSGHAVPGGMEKYPASLIGPLYAAIEDSPHFDDDFRLRTVNWLYKTFWQWCGHRRFQNWQPGQIRALGPWNVSRPPVSRGEYFKRYYPGIDLTRYDKTLENIQTGLSAIARDYSLFNEMGGYTRLGPTIVMQMFLVFDKMEFFESGNAAKFLDFLIQMTDNTGRRGAFSGLGRSATQDGWLYPLLYYKNPEYTWLAGNPANQLQPRLEPESLHYRLWTFIPRMQTAVPEHMAGIRTTAISPVAYQAAKRTDDPTSLFRPGGYDGKTPQERAYRILAMRSGFDFEKDQYLRMYGSSAYGGGVPNQITVLQHGRDGAGESFVVRRNGSGISFSMFSDLQIISDQPHNGFVRSVAHSDSADWTRNIFWRKGRYWIILDRINIRETHDYRLTCNWTSGNLKIQRAAGEPDFSGTLEKGDQYVHTTMTSAGNEKIRRINDNLYVVDEPETKLLIGILPTEQDKTFELNLSHNFTVNSGFFSLSKDHIAFAGLRRFAGKQTIIESETLANLWIDLANAVLEIDLPAPGAISFHGIKLLTAEGGHDTRIELESGRHEFKIEIDPELQEKLSDSIEKAAATPEAPVSFKSETVKYSARLVERRRTDINSPAQVIKGVDLTGNGSRKILAGLANGKVILLSDEGDKIWEFTADSPSDSGIFGAMPHSINDITTADLGDGTRVLATSGDRHVYCLDAETGKLVWKFSGDSLEPAAPDEAPAVRGDFDREKSSLFRPGGPMWAVKTADLNNDGNKQVLVGGGAWEGRNWFYGRLWVLDSAGKLQWHRFFWEATAVTQLGVISNEKTDHRYIAVAGHRYPYSTQVYIYDHTGNSVPFNHPGQYFQLATGNSGKNGEERLVTLNFTRGPTLRAFSPDIMPLWNYHVSNPFGFIMADMTGDSVEEIILAERGGIVSVIKESPDGTPELISRVNLRETLNWPRVIERQNHFMELMTTGNFTGKDRQIAVGSRNAVFVTGHDGTPLARLPGAPLALTVSGADGKNDSLVVGTADSIIIYDLQ